jgi:hypothetical protein
MAIVHASNQSRLVYAIGNGIQVLPSLPIVSDLLVSGNLLTAIPLLAMNADNPFTFDFSCNALISIRPSLLSSDYSMLRVTRSGISLIRPSKDSLAYHSQTVRSAARSTMHHRSSLRSKRSTLSGPISGSRRSGERVMQELVSTFRCDESSDARLLHFDASA